jgi:MscS family membrane protein
MLSYLVYNSIYNFIRTLILNTEDVLDDLLLLNLEKLRKPILLIVIIFGFELGLEVLFYPSHLVHAELWFYIAYLFIITYSAIILADNFFFELFFIRKNIKNKEMRRELINLMISVIKLTFILIAVLLLLIHLDVNITGIIASLGIGGLAVALAAKDTLSNFFGLIKIIVDNSFSQGDWIQSDTIEGTVVEIGFISTKIRTFDNALMTIPNASLANGILKNWNRRKVGRRIKMHITLEYSSSREDVQNAINDIYEMLQKHPHIVSPAKIDSEAISKLHKARKLISTEDKYGIKSTLLVYLDRFSDSSIDILVYSFSNTVNWKEWLEIKQDVHFKIWEIVEANNLNFAFPSQSIYLQNSSK